MKQPWVDHPRLFLFGAPTFVAADVRRLEYQATERQEPSVCPSLLVRVASDTNKVNSINLSAVE